MPKCAILKEGTIAVLRPTRRPSDCKAVAVDALNRRGTNFYPEGLFFMKRACELRQMCSGELGRRVGFSHLKGQPRRLRLPEES